MNKTTLFLALFLSLLVSSVLVHPATQARPYGQGNYGTYLYGNETYIMVSSVDALLKPSPDGTLAKADSPVFVYSTDARGFKIYVRALTDTSLMNPGAVLPTTDNAVPAPLAINTWGYNVDASDDYVGMTLTDTLVFSVNGPNDGVDYSLSYGVKIDQTKPAGDYSTTVLYTVVPQTD